MPTYNFFPRSWHDHWGGHLLSIVPVKADGDLKIRAARWLKTLFVRWICLDRYLEQRFIQYAYDNHTIIQHNFWLIHSLTLTPSLSFLTFLMFWLHCSCLLQVPTASSTRSWIEWPTRPGTWGWKCRVCHVIVSREKSCDSPLAFVGFLFELSLT